MIGSRIDVRDVALDVERGAGGLWNPRRPELSHLLNAFQLALPYLEPYFIDAIKQATVEISDPVIKADASAFCAQEANHARQHSRYCRLLRSRYPRLEEYEKAIRQSLVESRQNDPLAWRLAFTAGYEAITAQLARWMFRNQREWFHDADVHFAALMTWHAAEEIEHRHVAFDVLRSVSRSYSLRVKGMLAALRKTQADMTPVATYMLSVDGYGGFDSRARRLGLRLLLGRELLPLVIRYLTPGYHPSKETPPQGAVDWLESHRRGGAEGRVVDTREPAP